MRIYPVFGGFSTESRLFQPLEMSRDLNWSFGTGTLIPLVFSTTSLRRKDSLSLATLRISNEMRR
ncbi:hypothetical protein, partial [Okeania sp. SIO3B5]|uniref:hypothetical protein n=1 Tax=Okeania sp. SIO3B5 TaxID=2607811 RepID=UPI0025E18457